MSGGVDSTASALLLKEEFEISGFFMNLDQPDFESQKSRVEAIAKKIGIPLLVIDLKAQFKAHVLKYFSESYFNGLTPNPCVICNREIKFGLFMDAIVGQNFDKIATGHYAKVTENNDIFHLLKGVDSTKDQSYFLSRLTQTQLSRVLFPLGSMHKKDIYEFVKENGFNDFEGVESQDVCFLKNGKVGAYLDDHKNTGSTGGDIVNLQDEVVGRHNGLHHYTIGQRKGLGISAPKPYYVVALHSNNNNVIVGSNDDLFKNTITVKDMHWLSGNMPDLNTEFNVRIRYTHKGSTAKVQENGDDTFTLHFSDPQRAVTPGQFAVMYRDDEVIGSGVII